MEYTESEQFIAMILALSDGQAGRVLKAALRYFSTGREPRLDPVSRAAFEAIKRDFAQNGKRGGNNGTAAYVFPCRGRY